MLKPNRLPVVVLGDICLDVVSLPTAGSTDPALVENWRQGGELRTHYLPGGAMMLAGLIRAARQAGSGPAEKKGGVEWESVVAGPRPIPSPDISTRPAPLDEAGFVSLAPRLKRDEIIHSVISADQFPVTSDKGEKGTLPRVKHEHGYSGPPAGESGLKVDYGVTSEGRIVVLSDTGNQFRHNKDLWPKGILEGARLIVYKLHCPLPDSARPNALWNLVKDASSGPQVVIVDVDDLRAEGIPISKGLSWERTALDIVWHLLNVERLAELRDRPTLVIRLGLDGALVWTRDPTPAKDSPGFSARLVYDPRGIEGTFAASIPGTMVGYGSAFTAAVAESLANALSATGPVDPRDLEEALLSGARSGLLAARRLLTLGFEEQKNEQVLKYPGLSLFAPRTDKERDFADQSVPIIPGAVQPDRSYWRLLDANFNNTGYLPLAVELIATNRKGTKTYLRAQELLDATPISKFGNLTTFDRREIEHYRSLHSLLRDYLRNPNPKRPLSVAVFGPPGAGKSFGVKEVAKSLQGQLGCKEVEPLTFNLSLYSAPEDMAGAFHLVRDVALKGRVPLVFFDEFDTALGGSRLGWLRHFLSPMQDGDFLDRGAPHPIGPAIFVFAGGTCPTFAAFQAHVGMEADDWIAAKGPDFASRLRAMLDIPSLNLSVAFHRDATGPGSTAQAVGDLLKAQGLETFDPFGPIEQIPSRASVLLRRAGILAFNLAEKAPGIVRADKSLSITQPVLRALLHLPQFRHGNRSFEALLDMSHLIGTTAYTPAQLPPAFQTTLHADPDLMNRLVSTEYPFPQPDRETIAKAIHQQYLEDTKDAVVKTKAHRKWEDLDADDRTSNFEQADDIAFKLRVAGLWFRKRPLLAGGSDDAANTILDDEVEVLAALEHDRWIVEKRQSGWVAAVSTDPSARINRLREHNCLFSWNKLPEDLKNLDRTTARLMSSYLNKTHYQIYKP